jgi:large subunit ribosomal protein L12
MDMEYVYAAAILHELDREINERNMKETLEGAGADVSESRVKALIAALEDVNIDRAVADASPELGAGAAAEASGPDAAVPAETDNGQSEEPVETADETLPEAADDQEVEDDEEGGGLSGIFGS